MGARVIVLLGVVLAAGCAKTSVPTPPALPAPVTPAATAAPLHGALSVPATYEVKEKCARDARDWYKHASEDAPSVAGTHINSDYRNHYNQQLGRCLILVSSTTTTFARDGKTTTTVTDSLTDVLENRQLAMFGSTSDQALPWCMLDGIPCKSRDEWNAVTMRYMEE